MPDTARSNELDCLRGLGILLILLCNLLAYGMVILDFKTMSPLDQAIVLLNEALAGGSSRTLFCLVFGAGIVLFDQKYQSRDRYFLRAQCLIVLGAVNVLVFQWPGDILVVYGVASMVVYRWRHLNALTLLVIALVVSGIFYGVYHLLTYPLYELWIQAQAGEVAAWERRVALWHDQKATASALKSHGVTGGFRYVIECLPDTLSSWLLYDVPEAFVLMCVGIALYRDGYYSKSAAWHQLVGCTGLIVGCVVNGFMLHWQVTHEYTFTVSLVRLNPGYRIGNLFMAVGLMSTVLWLMRNNRACTVLSSLRAVGRLSLSNYLAQSIVMLLVFQACGGFGDWSVVQLTGLAICCGLLQLRVSVIWERSGRVGPAERLLKSSYQHRRMVSFP